MIENIYPVSELKAIYMKKRAPESICREKKALVASRIEEGWEVRKEYKSVTELKKSKPQGILLEDRVWCVLYRMGFEMLSGEGGSVMPVTAEAGKNQIDVMAIDREVALAIECKSMESFGKRSDFDKDIGKLLMIRERFIKAIHHDFDAEITRVCGMAIFTENINVTDAQRAKADEHKVVLMNEKDLEYYERLVNYLGPAAKYQFLADLFRNRSIPGLELTVPAIKGKMGGYNCYTFSISPEYLLKISYVSHRAKNHDADDTYQRMVTKSRLKSIRQYITDKGIFPTNIVISVDQSGKSLTFDQSAGNTDKGNGVMGWLHMKPSFGSAWVIDGQHRLFAYSGHQYEKTGLVSVIAFEGLPTFEQAKLFIDINNEQKSVKRSHLQELFGKLRWDAEDPGKRVDAIISRAIRHLSMDDPDGPFYERIQLSDKQKTETRCLSMQTVFSALSKGGLFIAHKRDDGSILAYGPLWAGDNGEVTVKRTVAVISEWFGAIKDKCPDWWNIGSREEGAGGLSMNDSVTACINVLRSVFQHLELQGCQCVTITDSKQLASMIRPYGEILGDFFSTFDLGKRMEWRGYRGIQGQNLRTRRCQEAICKVVPEFNPPGLDEFVATMKAKTNDQAKEIIDRMEQRLQCIVVQVLKNKFGPDESGWWTSGVPLDIRKKCILRREESEGERGELESYFDLIDYREIADKKWLDFQDVLGYGKGNESKDKRTRWIQFANEQRKKVAHASRGEYVSFDELAQLREYDEWLTKNAREVIPI